MVYGPAGAVSVRGNLFMRWLMQWCFLCLLEKRIWMKWMVWEMARIGLAVSLVLGTADLLFAQQTKEPGTPPQVAPIAPGLGMMGPALPGQPFNPFSMMGKSDVQAPLAAAYPIFQIMGPPISTGSNSADPATIGNMLLLQGELMMKMGEVMMKHGQRMLEKGK
jgi:hypothetical protein